jgi:hypothetical protein
MSTITGPLGLTLPVQNLEASQEVTMTPAEVTAWRNHLPMADLGSSAKKVYHAISDCNKVTLGLKDRFDILEILHAPAQFICQSLRKHYINQTYALTPQQLTIANLAQTIQMEMANGYKLLIEQLANKPAAELAVQILPIALQRVIHYFTYIIIRRYQLYSPPPKEIWHELHLLYKYADEQHLLKQNNIANNYKRVLLIAASYPYQWRQTEQDAIYKATEVWAPLATILDSPPNTSRPGFLVIDPADDQPPMSPNRKTTQFSSACKVLDVNAIFDHLKKLLTVIEPNELQARMTHANDPEYAVSTAILRGLIKEWGTPVTLGHDPVFKQETVRFCIGLMSTHYYLNGECPFQSPAANGNTATATDDTLALIVPILGLSEENSNIPNESNNHNDTAPTSHDVNHYSLHSGTLAKETLSGYELHWINESNFSIQPGEVMAIERQGNGNKTWEVCKIGWVQHQDKNEFWLDVEPFNKVDEENTLYYTPKAGSVQIIKEGHPVGYSLRCLLWETHILLPTIPFKTGNQVMVFTDNNTTPIELELTELVDVTGSYKRFKFTSKQTVVTSKQAVEANSTPATVLTPAAIETPKKDKPTPKDDDFNSIWSQL